jgi:hypothetical protein
MGNLITQQLAIEISAEASTSGKIDQALAESLQRLANGSLKKIERGRQAGRRNPPKKVRPGFGGSLAAREPVWDGEGWGCDRVAGS